jgi:type II secretory pathway pseudopilin PulG
MEIIVVLVILAIVAAALLPSFLNFVARARNDSLMAQARVGMVAAQFIATERGVPAVGGGNIIIPNINNIATDTSINLSTFITLVQNDVDNPYGFSNVTVSGNLVTGITYVDLRGNRVTITPQT